MASLTDEVAAQLCIELEEEEFEELWQTVEGIMRDSSYERQEQFARQWEQTPPRFRKQLLQQIILHDSK